MTEYLMTIVAVGFFISALWLQILTRQSRSHTRERERWMQELEDMEQLIDDVRDRARERGQRV